MQAEACAPRSPLHAARLGNCGVRRSFAAMRPIAILALGALAAVASAADELKLVSSLPRSGGLRALT
jgi:hypothetical protein